MSYLLLNPAKSTKPIPPQPPKPLDFNTFNSQLTKLNSAYPTYFINNNKSWYFTQVFYFGGTQTVNLFPTEFSQITKERIITWTNGFTQLSYTFRYNLAEQFQDIFLTFEDADNIEYIYTKSFLNIFGIIANLDPNFPLAGANFTNLMYFKTVTSQSRKLAQFSGNAWQFNENLTSDFVNYIIGFDAILGFITETGIGTNEPTFAGDVNFFELDGIEFTNFYNNLYRTNNKYLSNAVNLSSSSIIYSFFAYNNDLIFKNYLSKKINKNTTQVAKFEKSQDQTSATATRITFETRTLNYGDIVTNSIGQFTFNKAGIYIITFNFIASSAGTNIWGVLQNDSNLYMQLGGLYKGMISEMINVPTRGLVFYLKDNQGNTFYGTGTNKTRISFQLLKEL